MRSPRLRPLRVICLFTALISVLLAAQSHRFARANQPNALPVAHEMPAGVAAEPAPSAQGSPVKFAKAVTYSSGGQYAGSIAVADVNGDGRPDLVVANEFGEINGDGTVGVLLGNGDGTFQAVAIYDSGGHPVTVAVAVADVNGDGKPDLLVANWCGYYCSDGVVAVECPHLWHDYRPRLVAQPVAG